MSIGNKPKEGNKGSNHSYQSKNVGLLAKIVTLFTNTIALFTGPATPAVLNITAAGTTNAAWKSFTFVCVVGTVDIGTETFPPGAYSFSNGKGTLHSIAYDATASADCKIIYIS